MANQGGRCDRSRAGFYAGLTEDLLEFAEHEFALSAVQSDRATLRDHLEKHWRDSGEMPEELEPVDCPESLLYLWGYFAKMNDRRKDGAISNQEMESWAHLRGIVLARFEVDALDALESAYLKHQTAQRVEK